MVSFINLTFLHQNLSMHGRYLSKCVMKITWDFCFWAYGWLVDNLQKGIGKMLLWGLHEIG